MLRPGLESSRSTSHLTGGRARDDARTASRKSGNPADRLGSFEVEEAEGEEGRERREGGRGGRGER
jgi:hypothetical protein